MKSRNLEIEAIEHVKMGHFKIQTCDFLRCCEDRHRKMMKIPVKSPQNLGCELHIYQKHEMEIL